MTTVNRMPKHIFI